MEDETTGAVVLGDVEKVPRTISFLAIISAAFNLLSSWLVIAATMILGLSHGGSVTVVYGLIIALVMYGAVALSLSEMAARYPTAGGQYHWTALLAPNRTKRGLVSYLLFLELQLIICQSYSCGSINVISRVAMTASIIYIVAQLSLAMITFNNPEYSIKRYSIGHRFFGNQPYLSGADATEANE
ncbi:MAG: hypothetical protein Q9167_004771 [Letrouitia subvulpina]